MKRSNSHKFYFRATLTNTSHFPEHYDAFREVGQHNPKNCPRKIRAVRSRLSVRKLSKTYRVEAKRFIDQARLCERWLSRYPTDKFYSEQKFRCFDTTVQQIKMPQGAFCKLLSLQLAKL